MRDGAESEQGGGVGGEGDAGFGGAVRGNGGLVGGGEEGGEGMVQLEELGDVLALFAVVGRGYDVGEEGEEEWNAHGEHGEGCRWG